MSPKLTNFVPRIGAAYRLTDKTVIRGGYGIFNETLGRYARIQGGGPFQISETYLNTVANGVPLFCFPKSISLLPYQRERTLAKCDRISRLIPITERSTSST